MNIKEFIQEKFFNPEDFYYHIIGNKFPHK